MTGQFKNPKWIGYSSAKGGGSESFEKKFIPEQPITRL